MENLHPAMVIELASAAYQERIVRGLAAQRAEAVVSRGPSPRLALARVLVAVAGRLAPNTPEATA